MTGRGSVARWLSVFAVAAAALFVVACGSDSSDGTDTESTAGGGEAAVQEAKDFVAEHTPAPTEISVTEPVSKTPEEGKSIIYMDCGVPVCKLLGENVKEATDTLGWTFKALNTEGTPEGIEVAWNQAVREKPDAVVSTGVPVDLFKKQLAELQKAGTTVVNQATLDQPSGAVIANIDGAEDFALRGRWMANWIVADTDGEANVAYFGFPDFPVLVTTQEAFDEELKRLCPGCKSKLVEVTPQAIGKSLPSQVVSTLQSDPSINYVAMGLADGTLGVTQALTAAGIEGVKMVSQAGTPQNFENIVDGTAEVADVPESTALTAWTQIDALARHFNGDSLPQEAYASLPRNYLTADNIEDPAANYVGVVDYQDQFKALWKVK